MRQPAARPAGPSPAASRTGGRPGRGRAAPDVVRPSSGRGRGDPRAAADLEGQHVVASRAWTGRARSGPPGAEDEAATRRAPGPTRGGPRRRGAVGVHEASDVVRRRRQAPKQAAPNPAGLVHHLGTVGSGDVRPLPVGRAVVDHDRAKAGGQAGEHRRSAAASSSTGRMTSGMRRNVPTTSPAPTLLLLAIRETRRGLTNRETTGGRLTLPPWTGYPRGGELPDPVSGPGGGPCLRRRRAGTCGAC